MALLIQKFGGTCLATPERIVCVAEKIAEDVQQGESVCVVVSAMGSQTDELVNLAQKISAHPPERELDMLVTVGERISMSLLSMALHEKGISAISLTGSQSGILTSSEHSNARIEEIRSDRIQEGLDQNKVVIVAGFQGVSREKEITSLGRGGSDTTAVALAVALRADRCEIYTDVDGVYSANPKWVDRPRLHEKLSFEAMRTLASCGSQVLSERSVVLAQKHGFPVQVKNGLSFDRKGKGTSVEDVKFLKDIERSRIAGVSADPEKIFVQIELTRPATVAAFWGQVSERRLFVFFSALRDANLEIFIEKRHQEKFRVLFEELQKEGFVRRFEFFSEQSPVVVVGEGSLHRGEIMSRLTNTLQGDHTQIQGVHEIGSSVVFRVKGSEVQEKVREIHQGIFS